MIISLLSRGQRGPGQFDTASYVVDDTIQTAYLQFDPHNNELSTLKIVKVDMFTSVDDGQTWRHDQGFTAQGPWTFRPFIEIADVPRYVGKRVMGRIDLPQQINCGIQLFVNEIPPATLPF